MLDPSDQAFWTGLIVVALSFISALVTYLILTGLTPIVPATTRSSGLPYSST